jgi:hypothetical protein
MKYSLRSLLLVVTVVAVLTGLWVENWRTCRRREREHAEQASQLEEQAHKKTLLAARTYTGSPPPRYDSLPENQQARDHRSLEAEYRQARWRPWRRWWIDESRHAAKANGN